MNEAIEERDRELYERNSKIELYTEELTDLQNRANSDSETNTNYELIQRS